MTSKARIQPYSRSLLVTLTLGFRLSLALGLDPELTSQVQSATAELLRACEVSRIGSTDGRGVDTPGIKLARDYIAAEFAKDGLKFGGDKESYLQNFSVVTGVDVKQPSKLVLGAKPSAQAKRRLGSLGSIRIRGGCRGTLSSPATASPPKITAMTTTPASTSKARSSSYCATSRRRRTTKARSENLLHIRSIPRCAPKPTTPAIMAQSA